MTVGTKASTTIFSVIDACGFIKKCLFLSFPDNYEKMFLAQTSLRSLQTSVPFLLLGLIGFIFRANIRVAVIPLAVVIHMLISAVMLPSGSEHQRYLGLEYVSAYLGLGVMVAGLAGLARGNYLKCALTAFLAVPVMFLALDDYKSFVRAYVAKGHYFFNLDYKIGIWLKQNTPRETVVATFQAGGVRFFGERNIIDLGAITDPSTYKAYRREESTVKLLLDRNADYIAPFGDDYLAPDGFSLRDGALFERIPLECRGLFRIKKAALRAAFENRLRESKNGGAPLP